jgi:hypothetical protein
LQGRRSRRLDDHYQLGAENLTEGKVALAEVGGTLAEPGAELDEVLWSCLSARTGILCGLGIVLAVIGPT